MDNLLDNVKSFRLQQFYQQLQQQELKNLRQGESLCVILCENLSNLCQGVTNFCRNCEFNRFCQVDFDLFTIKLVFVNNF